MYVPPVDRNDPKMFDFGPVPQAGIYDLEVLDNVEGAVKSGRNEGVPKMTITFAVFGGANIKSSFHASIGSFQMKNMMEVLCPEILETGGEVEDGALVGRTCRGLVVNETYQDVPSGKIRRLMAPLPDGEDAPPPAPGSQAAGQKAANAPEIDPFA